MIHLLEKEELIRFNNDTTLIKEVLLETLQFSKTNLLLFNGRKMANYSQYFLEFLSRFRYNTEGLLNHIDGFRKDYRLKICVSQPLRSICADMLTALYLHTFYDKDDATNTAVKNELDIIATEYLHFIEQTIVKEDFILMELLGIKGDTLQERIDWFKSLAPDLLTSDGKIKKRKELRATTKDEIKRTLKPEGVFLTENEKFQRIKECGYSDYAFIFIAFKYYSQLQHFGIMSKKLIEAKPFHDTFWMILVIDHMLMVIDIILQITQSPNINFRAEIAGIRNKLETEFRKE